MLPERRLCDFDLTAAAIRRKQAVVGEFMTDDPKDRAIAVAEQIRARVEKRRQTDKLTTAQQKLLQHSARIFDEPATKKDAAAAGEREDCSAPACISTARESGVMCYRSRHRTRRGTLYAAAALRHECAREAAE
jgi:hypothetical protein